VLKDLIGEHVDFDFLRENLNESFDFFKLSAQATSLLHSFVPPDLVGLKSLLRTNNLIRWTAVHPAAKKSIGAFTLFLLKVWIQVMASNPGRKAQSKQLFSYCVNFQNICDLVIFIEVSQYFLEFHNAMQSPTANFTTCMYVAGRAQSFGSAHTHTPDISTTSTVQKRRSTWTQNTHDIHTRLCRVFCGYFVCLFCV